MEDNEEVKVTQQLGLNYCGGGVVSAGTVAGTVAAGISRAAGGDGAGAADLLWLSVDFGDLLSKFYSRVLHISVHCSAFLQT